MWVVIKYKKNEFNFLKEDFKKKLGELPEIYRPKFKFQKVTKNKLKFFEKDLLDDYLLCYHDQFKRTEIFPTLKNLRGLKYFLQHSCSNQTEIINFVNYCKKNQGNDGYLKQCFFQLSKIKKGIFLSGPFSNLFFNVIENQGKRLKILIGNIKTTISNKNNYLYRPV